ncbi:winged helix DNA-binding protein [Sphingomonas sp. ASV193]|uniref:winged helix DNA-binding protein n=1 Tax=Sphingomonas sp. ASV193 TaxID=3144405 RepID=UPI0032E8AB55
MSIYPHRAVSVFADRFDKVAVATAVDMIECRKLRLGFFEGYMFGEAAWDMLLVLFVAESRGVRLKVSDLTFESGAPPTTALRWLGFLEERGYIGRTPSPSDGRVFFVDLTDLSIKKMEGYLQTAKTRVLNLDPTRG